MLVIAHDTPNHPTLTGYAGGPPDREPVAVCQIRSIADLDRIASGYRLSFSDSVLSPEYPITDPAVRRLIRAIQQRQGIA